MKKKPTKYQAEIIKTALLRARSEAIRHMASLPNELEKSLSQTDINLFNDVLFDLFGE